MKPFIYVFICLIPLFYCVSGQAQVTYTANTQVEPLNDDFRYGVNPGWFANWGNLDTTLANISAGVPAQGIEGAGTNAWRAALFEHFVNKFGYDIRDYAFDHYETLGMTNHTVFVEGASSASSDPTMYCANDTTVLFDNLYLDIWDGGANGTPYNDSNNFAKYIYETVSEYKDHVKIWEIYNEPDFSYSANAYDPPSAPGSWWNVDPDPCEMKIKAPIYRYIRTLRIAYDVIKTVDPDAYVAIGGLGYPSFLDAVLRNTDNPTDGSVEANDYPLKGGAYFDVMSYHIYPHNAGCYRAGWNNATQQFDYQRHSDAGANCLAEYKDQFETVLTDHDYDGTTYPKKHFIITETNVPRDGPNFSMPWAGDNYGNDEIQRNWVIKALVIAQKNDLKQVHIYKLGEHENAGTPGSEFGRMGLFKNLNNTNPYTQIFTDEGKAFKTTVEELEGWAFDATKTAAMNLPSDVNGAAFKDLAGTYKYVLWAITQTDASEVASANYSFPSSFGLGNLNQKEWDASITGISSTVSSSGMTLSGAPVFLSEANCPPTLTVVQDYDNEEVELLQAGTVLDASNTIYAGADIIYQAGNCIELDPGFEVKVNAVFEATISGCN